jgi:regulator of protease activity HflC (stomatin/prohibitin superfamily)
MMSSVRAVPNRTELIIERFGRYNETWGPGLHWMIPFVDRVAFKFDLKEESIEVPPQDCFTRDNVRVEVDGILYLKVANSKLAGYGITDYRFGAIQLAQTTVRAVIGTLDLDRTFEEREVINRKVVDALNEVGRTWGVEVSRYEVKNIVPPPSVREAMERQRAAETERRTLMARAEGEKAARIAESEGRKQEFINRSQGDMQSRINQAEGKAEEILSLAKATADSVRALGSSLTSSGGVESMNLRLTQRMMTQLRMLGNGQKVLLPLDLTNVDDLMKHISLEPVPRMSEVPRAGTPVPVASRPPSATGATPTPATLPNMPAWRDDDRKG